MPFSPTRHSTASFPEYGGDRHRAPSAVMHHGPFFIVQQTEHFGAMFGLLDMDWNRSYNTASLRIKSIKENNICI